MTTPRQRIISAGRKSTIPPPPPQSPLPQQPSKQIPITKSFYAAFFPFPGASERTKWTIVVRFGIGAVLRCFFGAAGCHGSRLPSHSYALCSVPIDRGASVRWSVTPSHPVRPHFAPATASMPLPSRTASPSSAPILSWVPFPSPATRGPTPPSAPPPQHPGTPIRAAASPHRRLPRRPVRAAAFRTEDAPVRAVDTRRRLPHRGRPRCPRLCRRRPTEAAHALSRAPPRNPGRHRPWSLDPGALPPLSRHVLAPPPPIRRRPRAAPVLETQPAAEAEGVGPRSSDAPRSSEAEAAGPSVVAVADTASPPAAIRATLRLPPLPSHGSGADMRFQFSRRRTSHRRPRIQS
ncbi:hypothetical protein U9M48_035746 [Paspalum notatum var. saurae]|uniref:Uncharacterized protein n=1 Tax=Paspalum notatum var. saurae TaxID=547442 RepID=A0AAQ3UC67_PASNO